MGSNSGSKMRAKDKVAKKKRTPYLYQKGTRLYYRFVIPANTKNLPAGKEVRVCLRTCIAKEARKIITQLHSIMLAELERIEMDGNGHGDRPVEGWKEEMESLHKRLDSKVHEILNMPGKKILSQNEIIQRFNANLSKNLAKDMVEYPEHYELSETDPDGITKSIPEGEVWKRIGTEKIISAQQPENLEVLPASIILEMINDGIFSEDEITPENVDSLIKCYRIYEGKYYQALGARRNGDFSFENTLFPPILQPEVHETTVPKDKHVECSMLFSELVEKYCYIQVKDGNWKSHMRTEHESKLKDFIEIIGDKNITDITREDMRNFRDTLRNLPPNRNKSKEYRSKSINEILNMHPQKTLNIKTVNSHVESVSTLLTWAVREGYLQSNPGIGLSLKDDIPDINKKDMFTNEDIKILFYDGNYKLDRFSNPAFYWVPLIGLYTGMRLEEICQLECKDIYEAEDNVWVIDVRQDSSDLGSKKKVKTKNAVRIIPIHSELLRLGLLQYVREIEKNNIRLFPKLNVTEKTVKYGKQVGKNFSALIKKKGIEGKKSFHSLRHTFANFFKVHHLDSAIFTQIFGHEQKTLAGRIYGEKYSPKQCYDEIISKLNYF